MTPWTVRQERSRSVTGSGSYSNENRLTNVKLAAGTFSTYAYDGDGLRRSAIEPGGVLTTMIWDGTDYRMEKS